MGDKFSGIRITGENIWDDFIMSMQLTGVDDALLRSMQIIHDLMD